MSFKPEYQVLYEELLGHIRSGETPPGTMLPAERVLMENYRLSRTTVRRALSMLEELGVIVRRPGVGATVCLPPKPEGRKLRIGIDCVGSDQSYLTFLSEELLRASQDGRVELLIKGHEELMDGRGLDGAILAQVSPAEQAQLEADFRGNCPTVFLNRMPVHPQIGYFAVDYEDTSRQLVSRLFRNGAQRVAMIGGEECRFADQTRSRGWRTACMEHLGRVPEELFVPAVQSFDEFRNVCRMMETQRPEVLFVSRGSILTILCVALSQCGLVPGKDVDLVCFDHVERIAEANHVPVSYIKMPFARMVRGALEYIGAPTGAPVPKEIVNAQLVVDGCRFLL